jgi:starch phosphorylase
MTTSNMAKGLAYSDWRANLERNWKNIQIREVKISESQIKVGKPSEVEALVYLGQLTPKDVRVQLYYGQLSTHREIMGDGETADMESAGTAGDGLYRFKARVTYNTSGERGLSVRVLPQHEYLPAHIQPGLITWAKGS